MPQLLNMLKGRTSKSTVGAPICILSEPEMIIQPLILCEALKHKWMFSFTQMYLSVGSYIVRHWHEKLTFFLYIYVVTFLLSERGRWREMSFQVKVGMKAAISSTSLLTVYSVSCVTANSCKRKKKENALTSQNDEKKKPDRAPFNVFV